MRVILFTVAVFYHTTTFVSGCVVVLQSCCGRSDSFIIELYLTGKNLTWSYFINVTRTVVGD